MPIVQKIDMKRFQGSGFYAPQQAQGVYKRSLMNEVHMKPYPVSKNNHEVYLKRGEAFDFASLIDTVKNVGSVINDNKETIGSVASAVSNVSNAAKSISDTVKLSKELEKIKQVKQIAQHTKSKQNKQSTSKDIELSEEQLENLKKLGNGFVKVSVQ
jgi:mannose/fructose/N-acetylgalactosamine-specific phosphotransferase system component IIB